MAAGRREMLLYGSGVAVVGVGVVGGFLSLSGGGNDSGPKSVARSFVVAAYTDDTETVATLLSERYKAAVATNNPTVTEQELRELYTRASVDRSDVTFESIEVDSRSDTRAQVEAEVIVSKSGEFDDRISLTIELTDRNGEWHIYSVA